MPPHTNHVCGLFHSVPKWPNPCHRCINKHFKPYQSCDDQNSWRLLRFCQSNIYAIFLEINRLLAPQIFRFLLNHYTVDDYALCGDLGNQCARIFLWTDKYRRAGCSNDLCYDLQLDNGLWKGFLRGKCHSCRQFNRLDLGRRSRCRESIQVFKFTYNSDCCSVSHSYRGTHILSGRNCKSLFGQVRGARPRDRHATNHLDQLQIWNSSVAETRRHPWSQSTIVSSMADNYLLLPHSVTSGTFLCIWERQAIWGTPSRFLDRLADSPFIIYILDWHIY